MKNIELAIGNHPVFASLGPDECAFLVRLGHSRHIRKGEFIVQQGDVWANLFLLVEGWVVVQKESFEGRNLIATSLGKGDLFWGLAFFEDGAPMPATLEASKDSHLFMWNRVDFLPFLLQHGQVLWELSCLTVRRMAQASEIIETLAFQPVAGRLARFLVDISPEDNSPVARSLTLDEIAARVGSTREVVCRFLQRFANDGLIDITRTEFVINNSDGLRDIARHGKG